eukprot:4250069-Amphidinium_carterae.3
MRLSSDVCRVLTNNVIVLVHASNSCIHVCTQNDMFSQLNPATELDEMLLEFLMSFSRGISRGRMHGDKMYWYSVEVHNNIEQPGMWCELEDDLS